MKWVLLFYGFVGILSGAGEVLGAHHRPTLRTADFSGFVILKKT